MQADIGKLGEVIGHELNGVVILLDLRCETAIDRSNLPTEAVSTAKGATTAWATCLTVLSASHKKSEMIKLVHLTIGWDRGSLRL